MGAALHANVTSSGGSRCRKSFVDHGGWQRECQGTTTGANRSWRPLRDVKHADRGRRFPEGVATPGTQLASGEEGALPEDGEEPKEGGGVRARGMSLKRSSGTMRTGQQSW